MRRTRRKPRQIAFAAAFLAALVVIASAGARTIVGTPRADVLRGTKAGDAIYGRGGNDRLFGLGGNDRLYGGAGADRISCGAGADRVFADARDIVGSDCEHVTGRQPPPPHHPPAPPPVPPPPSPPPPPPAEPSWVVPGHYVALTEQARYVHLEVFPDGRALRNLRVEFDAECSPPRSLRGPFADVGGDVAIDADGRFSVAVAQDGGRLRVSIDGTFDRVGTLRVRSAFRRRSTTAGRATNAARGSFLSGGTAGKECRQRLMGAARRRESRSRLPRPTRGFRREPGPPQNGL